MKFVKRRRPTRSDPLPSPSALTAEEPMPCPLVTVAIPARNEEATIEACLSSVLQQDYQHIEVLVVDGGSTDGTRNIVSTVSCQDARVRLIRGVAGSIPRSLNLALAAARGVWLVRVDAHSTIPVDYVSTGVSVAQTGGWLALGGRKNAVASTPVGFAIAAALNSRFGVGNSYYHYGAAPRFVDHVPFGIYSTRMAQELGGWDERLTVNEDFEFDQRVRLAGHSILFDPRLVIYWRCRESVFELFNQYMRYGEGKPTVAWLHPDSLKARHLAPPALILLLGTAAVAAPRSPRTAVVLSAPYVVALIWATLATWQDVTDPRARHQLPAIFTAMHVGYGVGFIRGLRRIRAVATSATRRGFTLRSPCCNGGTGCASHSRTGGPAAYGRDRAGG
jgi:succinoglycan biosynthesis protein ExoA